MAKIVYLACLLGVLVSTLTSADARKGTAQKLWESLERTKYQAWYRPANVMNISLNVDLISLSNFDSETSTLSVGYYLKLIWKDPTISWDRKKFNLLDLSLFSEEVWLPDIVAFNADSHEKVIDNRVVVSNNGDVINVPYLKTRVTCQRVNRSGNLRQCRIKFGSWTLDGNKLNISSKAKLENSSASFTGLEESGWAFVNGTTVYENIRYPCCVETYPSITVILTIRKSGKQDEEEASPEEKQRDKRRNRSCQMRRKVEEEEEEEEEEAEDEERGKRFRRRKSQNRRRGRRFPMRRRRRTEEDDFEDDGEYC